MDIEELRYWRWAPIESLPESPPGDDVEDIGRWYWWNRIPPSWLPSSPPDPDDEPYGPAREAWWRRAPIEYLREMVQAPNYDDEPYLKARMWWWNRLLMVDGIDPDWPSLFGRHERTINFRPWEWTWPLPPGPGPDSLGQQTGYVMWVRSDTEQSDGYWASTLWPAPKITPLCPRRSTLEAFVNTDVYQYEYMALATSVVGSISNFWGHLHEFTEGGYTLIVEDNFDDSEESDDWNQWNVDDGT